MAGHPSLAPELPEGVVVHLGEGLQTESTQALSERFAEIATSGESRVDSLAMMMGQDSSEVIVAEVLYGAEMVREIQPHAVVCNVPHNAGNFLHAVCRSSGISFICVNSTARRETQLDDDERRLLDARHPGILDGAQATAEEVIRLLESQLGSPLPPEDLPLTLFPGSSVLVKGSPRLHEFFTGPFIPLPRLKDDGPERQWQPQEGQEHADLFEWLSNSGNSDPVVYLALGSIVRPSQDLLRRLVEALDVGPWRVLWSLPKSLHAWIVQRCLEGEDPRLRFPAV